MLDETMSVFCDEITMYTNRGLIKKFKQFENTISPLHCVSVMQDIAVFQYDNENLNYEGLLQEQQQWHPEDYEDTKAALEFLLENNIIEIRNGLLYEGPNFHNVIAM